MVDATKRKLQVPPRFVPYMETHRLYELFHDLITELVINQPGDHISFLRKTLGLIMNYRDKPRVILIAPPDFDKLKLGDLISNITEAVCLTPEEIYATYYARMKHEEYDGEDGHLPDIDLKTFSSVTSNYLRNMQFVQNGWILVNYPNTLEEAKSLVHAGIIPTHTFHISFKPVPEPPKVIDYISVCKKPEDPELVAEREIQKEYQRNLLDMLDVFYQSLNLIEADGKTYEEIAESCSRLAAVRNNFSRPPMLPRILLIGPIGSGRATQANLLCERFNLIHVDLSELLAQVRQEQSELSSEMRRVELNRYEISSKLMLTIIERRLKAQDCTNQGWVLTGYPRHTADFIRLDHSTLPPNRVMFLNVSLCECMVRLSGRRYHMHTGTEFHLGRNPPHKSEAKDLKVQPQDDAKAIIAKYNAQIIKVREMKDYAGGSGIQIDGTQALVTVHERICHAVMKPSVCEEPREGVTMDSDEEISP